MIEELQLSKQAAGQLVDLLVMRAYLKREVDSEERGRAAAEVLAVAGVAVDNELISGVGPKDTEGHAFVDVNLAGAQIRNVNLAGVTIEYANVTGMSINGALVTDLDPRLWQRRAARFIRQGPCDYTGVLSRSFSPGDRATGGGSRGARIIHIAAGNRSSAGVHRVHYSHSRSASSQGPNTSKTGV